VRLARQSVGVYVPDIAFGLDPHLRGHWQDRLPAIDEDLADMERQLEFAANSAPSHRVNDQRVLNRSLRTLLNRPKRPTIPAKHTPSARFQTGQPLMIRLALPPGTVHGRSLSVRLLYRHLNQAEEFRASVISAQSDTFEGVIPADYTNSPFPIQYYFELRDGKGQAWLQPGLGPDLDQRPYYVVRQMRKSPS
jgi:hypothetical protein